MGEASLKDGSTVDMDVLRLPHGSNVLTDLYRMACEQGLHVYRMALKVLCEFWNRSRSDSGLLLRSDRVKPACSVALHSCSLILSCVS